MSAINMAAFQQVGWADSAVMAGGLTMAVDEVVSGVLG